jgi:two-component system, sensor histidine kinase RpfC
MMHPGSASPGGDTTIGAYGMPSSAEKRRNERGPSRLLERLGFSAREGRDADREQATLRIVIGGGVLLYALGVMFFGGEESAWLELAAFAALLTTVTGVWMRYWFGTHRERPDGMRYLAICSDLIPLTVGLWCAGEPGVPLIGIYLWVTIGNGLRFGMRFLWFSYALTGLCFGALLLFVPFWQLHRSIGIGFGVVLATIPLYASLLLSRITAQKDAALELSNAKSRFVANVSHELRTPLTGIYSVYDLLRRQTLSLDGRELVTSLGAAISTLKASVDAVLQMSKLEAGAECNRPRLMNLRYFLLQLSALVQPQATAKGLTWTLDVDQGVPCAVRCDASHLHHILGNLINNAIKFTPKGSVTLRVASCPSGVRFDVTDTGIGIPLDKQEGLFERFVQADISPTRKYGGTGLGTSIAHDLVRLMGGTIGVLSAPSCGSTFWVELPMGSPYAAPVPDWGAQRTVLVVGDGPCNDLVAALLAIGLEPELSRPHVQDPPSFSASKYLAALLALPASRAAGYADSVLRQRAGTACPWLVVHADVTSGQEGALLRSGAVGVLREPLSAPVLEFQLAALTERLGTPEAESVRVAATQRHLRILLADDHASNQMLFARILRDAGHEAKMVSKGDEAYDLMMAGGIDLALLDLNMPGMSGPDAVKLFRAGEVGSGAKLPIIILSADATNAAREESLAAGANDYLTKPVSASTLLATIERVLAGVELPPRSASPTAPPVSEPTEFVPASKPAFVVPAAATGGLLVDTERVEALRSIANNDRQFLGRYVEAAFTDMTAAVHELQKAVESCDVTLARDALHKIEGTAVSVGAPSLLACVRQTRERIVRPDAQSGNARLMPDTDGATSAIAAELASLVVLTKSAVWGLLCELQETSRPS